MYRIQEKPHARSVLTNGAEVKPLVTLVNEGGDACHIIMDDGCYVLVVPAQGGGWGMSKHWFPEAAQALAGLMAAPVDACDVDVCPEAQTPERNQALPTTMNLADPSPPGPYHQALVIMFEQESCPLNAMAAAELVRKEIGAYRKDPTHLPLLPFPIIVDRVWGFGTPIVTLTDTRGRPTPFVDAALERVRTEFAKWREDNEHIIVIPHRLQLQTA